LLNVSKRRGRGKRKSALGALKSIVLRVGAGFKPVPTGMQGILVAQAFQPGHTGQRPVLLEVMA